MTKSKSDLKLHKIQNNLKSNAKAVSIDVLNARLADGKDLALLTKQAHWTLKAKARAFEAYLFKAYVQESV